MASFPVFIWFICAKKYKISVCVNLSKYFLTVPTEKPQKQNQEIIFSKHVVTSLKKSKTKSSFRPCNSLKKGNNITQDVVAIRTYVLYEFIPSAVLEVSFFSSM